MNKMKWVLLAIPAAFLFGCASPAKMENMTYHPRTPLSYDRSLKNEVGVNSTTGGEKTNPLWTSEISSEAFSGAVKNSLKSQGLLSDNGRYQLQIKMLKTDQPIFGMNLTVTTKVNYILTDKTNHSIVLNETIEAPYTATVEDAFVAAQRLRLANEGSGRMNIRGLLERLSKLRIDSNEVSVVE